MKLRSRKLALQVLIASMATSSFAIAAASAQDQSAADLGVALKTNTSGVQPNKRVYLRVTVTNHGPATAIGFQVKLTTRGGLTDPSVVATPPDKVETTCPMFGEGPCRTKWIGPHCLVRRTELSCRYRHLQLSASGGADASVTLVLKVTTGQQRHETATAVVHGSDDPNPANDHASVSLGIEPPR